MKKKRWLVLSGGVCLILVLALLRGASAQPTPAPKPSKVIELTYATYGTEWCIQALQAKEWARLMEQRTNGQVKVKKWFWGGSLLKADALIEGCAKGMVDIVYGLASPAMFPNSQFPCTMFGGEREYYAGLALARLYKKCPELYEEARRNNIEILYQLASPWPMAFVTNKPIHKLEDANGQKIRVTGGTPPLALGRLGMIPVSMSIADVYMAMEKGNINGAAAIPLWAITEQRYYEVGKQLLELGYGNYSATVTGSGEMNLGVYKKLAAIPGVAKIIEDLYWEISYYSDKINQEMCDEAVLKARQAGLELYTLPADEQKRWLDVVKPEELRKNWLAEQEKKGVPASKLQALFEEELDKIVAEKGLTYVHPFVKLKKGELK